MTWRPSVAGRPAIDVDILEREQTVSRWHVREVPQIQRAVIVIDDLGQDIAAARRLLQLPYPLTLSVIPNLRYSSLTAGEAHRAGRDVMLHLPMQPESGFKAGPNQLEVGMAGSTVRRVILRDLASVPYASGVNNHMGSRATADSRLMRQVMQVLSERRLYFVDSRTTPDTVALDTARRLSVPAFYRSVFLDDVRTVEYTLTQLGKFQALTEEQGVALAIGHPYATTIAALERFLPQFVNADVEVVPASTIVRLPEAARLSPPSVPARARGSPRLATAQPVASRSR